MGRPGPDRRRRLRTRRLVHPGQRQRPRSIRQGCPRRSARRRRIPARPPDLPVPGLTLAVKNRSPGRQAQQLPEVRRVVHPRQPQVEQHQGPQGRPGGRGVAAQATAEGRSPRCPSTSSTTGPSGMASHTSPTGSFGPPEAKSIPPLASVRGQGHTRDRTLGHLLTPVNVKAGFLGTTAPRLHMQGRAWPCALHMFNAEQVDHGRRCSVGW